MTDAVTVPPVTSELPEDATPIGDLLPVAVRCYMEQVKPEKPAKLKAPRGPLKLRQAQARPDRMLVIDCETVTAETLTKTSLMPGFDPDAWPAYAQSLLFGSAHLYVRGAGGRKWHRTHEWTFYPDNLPPTVTAKLRRRFEYDSLRMGDWREPKDSPDVKAYLVQLSEFLKVFFREAVSKRCLIVGFNLPFDLSRLAFRAGQARGRFVDGFSFVLWKNQEGKEDRYRPRLTVKAISPNATFMAFGSIGEHGSSKRRHPGAELLDLRQLIYGLTGDAHSLNSACEALGVSDSKTDPRYHGCVTLRYLRYNRQDVLLTARLAIASLDLFDTHPISRGHTPQGAKSEINIYSPASLTKAYLYHMGVRPRLKAQPDFPKQALAAAMQAFSAARSETWIHNESIPVAPLDFTSTFPTVTVLQELWQITIAKTVEVRDSTQDVRHLLENVTPGKMFDPAAWTELNQFALTLPQGDILPTRAMYGTSAQADWKIGLNPYTSERPQWYALADLVDSKIRTERTPKVLEAFRLVPHGLMQGLRPVRFAGAVMIDPASDDFFRRTVEERARIQSGTPPYDDLSQLQRDASAQAVKTIANAGAWGIYFETNPVKLPRRETRTLSLWLNQDDIRTVESHYPQEPGPFFFPPIASLVTAGARLLLALLQHEVEARGASYVTADTDSLFATYHPDGGLIDVPGAAAPVRLLDPVELAAIRTRLNRLNPYNLAIVPDLVKHEHADRQPLHVYSIITKRYALFVPTAGGLNIVDRSESALGGILPTTTDSGWIDKWWASILEHKQLPMPDGPLVYKFAVHTWETLNLFKTFNDGKDYQAQVKAFNFFMSSLPSAEYPDDPTRPMHSLVAPLDANPDAWLKSTWYDVGSGEPSRIVIKASEAADVDGDTIRPVCVRKFHDYFEAYYKAHPAEFRPPPGGWGLGGMLHLRSVRQASLTLIGKEDTRFIELARAGLVKDDESQIELELNPDWVIPLLPILDELPREPLYTELQVNPTTFRRWISGVATPSDHFRQRLEEICAEHVDRDLRLLGIPTPTNHANAFELYASIIPALKVRIAATLKAFTEKGQASDAGRELSVNRRTMRRWIVKPDAIPASRTLNDLALSYPEAVASIAAQFSARPSATAYEKPPSRQFLPAPEPPAAVQPPAPPRSALHPPDRRLAEDPAWQAAAISA